MPQQNALVASVGQKPSKAATTLNTDANGNLVTVPLALVPAGATQITASSGSVANANAVATLAAVAGKTTYIDGFTCTASGATAASVVTVTVTGVLGGTMTFIFTAPAGATLGATTLNVRFAAPIPASAANTAIVVTLPALGAGNTNAAVVATGFQL